MACPQPIGVFDSGFGGLTVLKEIVSHLPHEHYIYLGDTARVPYGDKSRETIIRYFLENALFLMEQGIKVLVIACNTASAYSAKMARKFFNVPIVDVIEAGVTEALKHTKNNKIAVLGTRATIQSGVYKTEILKKIPYAEVISVACPLFVPLVEEDFLCHPATELIVREYLQEIKRQNVDTVLLGCTHYPLLKDLIVKVLGSDIFVVDSAKACARQTSLLLEHTQKSSSEKCSFEQCKFYVSDNPEKFAKFVETFLGFPKAEVEKISLAGFH